MRILTLSLSFLLLFCFASLCFFLVLWDTSMIVITGTALSRAAATFWGKSIVAAIGLIGLGCSLSLLSMLLGLNPGSRQHVLLENEAGTVGVSIDAIEDFVKRKGETVRGVRALQVHAEMDDDGLIVRNKVVLELQRNIPEFIHEFQSMMQHELNVTLGLHNLKEVKVLIHKLFPKDGSKEPKLLSGPQTVMLKQDQAEHEEETEPSKKREDSVKIITPTEFREKDGSS